VSGAGLAGDTRLPEKGLGLALEILEQVARDDRGASAAEIARAVGAPRATVYRVVNSLVRDEYLVPRPAHAAVVDRLRSDTGEAVHLFAFHRSGLLVLDEDAAQPLSDPDALLADPTRSAIGHLWLVAHPDRRLQQAPSWRVDPASGDVRAIHEAYAVRGYTEQVALLSSDRGCLAVPIHDEAARPVGAVTLSTAISRLSVAARHVGALRDAARALAPIGALSDW
jgi:DNA-binding IclR family transcriptional regulator